MKKINRNIGLFVWAVLAVGNSSCDKMLDVPPQNKLTLSQFWLSKDQAVAAISGIYSTVGSSSGSSSTSVAPLESYIYWGEIRGELLKSNPGKLKGDEITKENADNFTSTPNDANTKFTAFYKIVNLANQAIKNIPDIVKKDPSFSQIDADQLTGEAYFLRAFSYFWLVRTFKEVPLVLVPSETDNQDYNTPKSTADSIFAQIVKDLEIAKKTLPEWYDNVNYAKCRATKYSAMAMESDAYLWMASISKDETAKNILYQKVIDNCDAIINSGRYFMLHGSRMATIYSTGRTEESIFETYSNSKLNNQINNLSIWFNTNQFFVITASADPLFSSQDPDYRSANVPTGGTYPIPSSAFSYRTTDYTLLKYNKSTRDAVWNFYRFSEVLLMKAEAIAHLYKDNSARLAEALDLVNEVRERAFGINTYVKAVGSSTLDVDEILLDERGREFLGEGKRWFELVRFASRDNFAHPELLSKRILGSFSGTAQYLTKIRISDPASWYLPLNADALAANPNLVQNPYYE